VVVIPSVYIRKHDHQSLKIDPAASSSPPFLPPPPSRKTDFSTPSSHIENPFPGATATTTASTTSVVQQAMSAGECQTKNVGNYDEEEDKEPETTPLDEVSQ